MITNNNQAESLVFRRGDVTASIATNLTRNVTQIGTTCVEHPTLIRAISYLEARGFKIDIDNSKSY